MTTDAERSYRRRIFATALPDDFPSDALQQSMSVLDQEFGDVEKLKYSDVISRLETNLVKAEVNLNLLLGRIMQLQRKKPDELDADPFGKGTATPVTPQAPRETVFNALFSAVTKQVDRRGQLDELRLELKKNAFTLGLAANCVQSLTAWADQRVTTSRITGSNADLHKVINHVFVWMCNKYGPVDADRILIASVKFAEALPEAFDCSPREFL